jgi:hypothetical protein
MHARHRVLPALLALGAVLAVGAGTALAKEGAVAQLDAPVRMDTPPGTIIDIGWSVFAVDGEGTSRPIFGSPIYVRIVPAGGGAPVEVAGTERPAGSGHYVASVIVPAGGIGTLEIAMHGQACDGSTCWEADYVFPMNDDPRIVPPPVAGSVPAGGGAAMDQGPLALLVATVTGLAVLAALVALVLGHRDPSAARPA